MFERLSQFHFLHPLWLLALVPLVFIYRYLKRQKASDSGWSKIIDAHLLPVLMTRHSDKVGRSFSVLLLLAWVISVFALANPVWQKKPKPVFQTNIARVIVLDLSRSMLIKDVKPSRLARARFKIEDILNKEEEGQLALVVFAGDAFTVTPLTRDVDTIRAMLPALHPMMMPVQGSRADLGLLKADELLTQAGVPQAQIILIADGAEDSALVVAKKIRQRGHRVSVLGIGTKEGAPIPNVRDQDGKSIVVGMQEPVLKAIAAEGGGHYSELRSGSEDIDTIFSLSQLKDGHFDEVVQKSPDMQSQDWVSEGPWLVLLLLPLAAFAFRRGWLLSVGFAMIMLGQPQPAVASVWDSLWKRHDQQADQALKSGDYELAESLAESPFRRGSAAYKKGDYQQALNDFSQVKSADGFYNKGNTLAHLNKIPEAINAYKEALKQRPDMEDAKENKKKLEELLKKQKEKKQKEKKQKQKNQQKNNQDKKKKDNNKDNKDNEGQKGKQDPNDQKGSQGDKQQKDNKQSGKQKQQSDNNQFAKANEDNKDDKDRNDENNDQAKQANNPSLDDKKKQEQEQKVAAQERKEDKKGDEKAPKNEAKQAAIAADELSKEEKLAAEQWLRRIPDDPGGLLKRKFRYQYQRRQQPPGTGGQRPW